MAEALVYRPDKREFQQVNQANLQQNSPLKVGLFLCEAAKKRSLRVVAICGRVINSAVNPPENATLPIFARLEQNSVEEPGKEQVAKTRVGRDNLLPPTSR